MPSVQDARTRQSIAWAKLPVTVLLTDQYLKTVWFLRYWWFFNYSHIYRYYI